MRAIAILISTLTLAACSLEPQMKIDGKSELSKLEGPEVGSVSKSLLAQAQEAESNGDFKRAAQTYRQLADQTPNDSKYKILEADSLRRSGGNDLAIRVISKVIQKEPANIDALEVQGLCLLNLGEFNDAQKAFDKVMKADSKRWRTLNAIGIMFAIKKMNNEAVEYYTAALKINPDNAGVLNNLGLSLAMNKDYNGAVDKFMQARNRLPANSPEVERIDLNLALVYAIQGKLDEAEQTASPHLSKAGLYNNMGFYAYINKNKELSKSYLSMALTQNPVYYDRAWKNLSAITGENASESNSQSDEEKDQAVQAAEKQEDSNRLNRSVIDPKTENLETKPVEKMEASVKASPPVKAEVKPVEVVPTESLPPTKVYPEPSITNTQKATLIVPQPENKPVNAPAKETTKPINPDDGFLIMPPDIKK